jgi:CRISPR/Cas system-associated exonuclease Cas4 (RecB family)
MTTEPLQVIPDERENKPSASGMYMLSACPGSAKAQEGLPELPAQKVTEDGNLIHDALHKGDDSELELTQREIAAKLKQMEQSAFEEWKVEHESEIGGGKILEVRETRFWVRNPRTLELIASAKPDVVYVYGFSCALVIDYKSGFADTMPAERNWQLHCQALAIRQEYRVHKVRAAIAHKRLSSKFDSVDYDVESLARIEREILHMVWRSQQPDAPRVPGSWCRYCRFQGLCPELAAYSLMASAKVPVLANGKPDQLAVLDAVNRLTPKQLALVHERETIATFFFECVEAQMKRLPKDVLAAVGYQLKPGNNLKEIVDAAQAFARLGALLTDVERFQCIDLYRGRAAKFVAERANISEKEAQKLVDEALGDAVKEKRGNERLRPL